MKKPLKSSIVDQEKKRPRAVSVIIDEKTGRPFVGESGKIKSFDDLHPDLQKIIPKESLEAWTKTYNCAEVDAYNKALKAGVKPKNMEMHTVFIEHGPDKKVTIVDAERCKNCKITTKDIGTVSSD